MTLTDVWGESSAVMDTPGWGMRESQVWPLQPQWVGSVLTFLATLPLTSASSQASGRTPGSAQQRSPKKFQHGENLPQLGSQAVASTTCLLQSVKPTAATGLGLREIIFNWINTDNTAKAGSLLTPGVTFNASLHSELHTISHSCECTAQTENSLTPQKLVCTRGQ